MEKRYKEPNKLELETTINVLYEENVISIYTNKPNLQKQLCKSIGEPEKEFKKGKSILASRWCIPMSEKSKISKMMLKANIFEL